MEKIDFKNLPDKTTPINAANLNKMQDNTEKAIGEKLDKTSKATSTEAIAGTNNTKYTTPCSVKSAIDKALEGYTPSGGGSGGDTLPIGAILPFSSDTIPNGWLLCDGRAVSRTEYAELFKAIGTKHGSGDGSTTFNLPNPKGRTLVGKDSSDTDFNELGKTGGEKTHTLTVSEMPKHSHNFQFDQTEGSNVTAVKTGVNNAYAKATSETGGSQPHNNLQPYLVTNFIIKAKNTAVVKGDVIQEDGTASTTNVYSAKAIDNKLKTSVKVEESGDGYTKYSDGTMVCYGTASITNPTHNDWYGFCRLSNEFTFNLAKTFKDNNYSLTISSTVFGYFSTIITSKTTNSFGFRACTHNQSAYTPKNGTFDYIAIGKWK